MQICLNWPKGTDDEVLHLFFWAGQESHMLPCEDVSVGPKKVTTRSFTWSLLGLDQFLDSLTEWLNEFFGNKPLV
jgi:hypothetical protein